MQFKVMVVGAHKTNGSKSNFFSSITLSNILVEPYRSLIYSNGQYKLSTITYWLGSVDCNLFDDNQYNAQIFLIIIFQKYN